MCLLKPSSLLLVLCLLQAGCRCEQLPSASSLLCTRFARCPPPLSSRPLLLPPWLYSFPPRLQLDDNGGGMADTGDKRSSPSLSDIEINLPAIRVHGHQLVPPPPPPPPSSSSAAESPPAPASSRAKIVGQKRKFSQDDSLQSSVDDGSEPKRRNRNRDFQTNGW